MQGRKTLISVLLLVLFTVPTWVTSAFAIPDTLNEYEQERQELLSENENINASSGVLSEAEQKVDRRLESLKKLTNYRPDRPFYEHVNPENDQAAKTELFLFLRQMPKGASLHTHSTALLSSKEFFEICMNVPDLYIYTQETDGKHLHGALKLLRKGVKLPKGFESFNAAAKNLGRWHIIKSWTIGADDKGKNVWDVFENEFNIVIPTISEPEVFYEYFRRAFLENARDGLQRLEVRTTLPEVTGENLQKILRAYKSVQKEYPDFTIKFIVSEHKSRLNDAVKKISRLIEMTQKLKKDYPDYFLGIDLVGEEDNVIPLKDFAEEFIKAENAGKDFDLYLHAGESMRPENDMMIDAYILGTKRIGHGFNLFRYPELEKKLIKEKIALEVCPISNHILGYVSDLRDHPARNYFKRGVPIVIAADDPFMFGTAGSTYDFYAIVLAWDLRLADIKQLCLNSIEYSGGTDEERQKLKSVWQKSWDEFIKRWSDSSTLSPAS